jgi:hypothetical protein
MVVAGQILSIITERLDDPEVRVHARSADPSGESAHGGMADTYDISKLFLGHVHVYQGVANMLAEYLSREHIGSFILALPAHGSFLCIWIMSR